MLFRSLVAMLSIGVGLQDLAGNRLTRSGLFNTVMVSEWRSVDQMRREGQQPGGGNVRPDPASMPDVSKMDAPPVLNDAARAAIAKLAGVSEVEPELRFTGEITQGEKSLIAQMGGLPASAHENEAFDNMRGKF